MAHAARVWQTAAMRVLLYEWCSSGGLEADDATIAAEGKMMLEALAADAVKTSSCDVTVLVDASRPISLPSRVRTVSVQPGHDTASLVAAARVADWTVVVAPETDGVLLDRIRAVRAAGGRLLSPPVDVVAIASDKQSTAETLAAAGIAVPAGRSLAPAEPWPTGFRRPAVRKARAAAGGAGFVMVRATDREPAAATAASRIEAAVRGIPVGVACIAGPAGVWPLHPMRQRYSEEPAHDYLGSEPLAEPDLAARAVILARRAVIALAGSGWLGVDLVLGPRADGRDDRVLEVNPRITSSFVGHAAADRRSLVLAIIDAIVGRKPWPAAGAARPSAFEIPRHAHAPA